MSDTPKVDGFLLYLSTGVTPDQIPHAWVDPLVTFARNIERESNDHIELLREAETLIRHTRCIDEDAMKCPGCSLEARIYDLLRKHDKETA